MEEVSVSTEVYVPPSEAFAFLRDFDGYAEYSPYLENVRQFGTGEVGTEYELTATWWRIDYRARTEVTGIVPPHRIEWRVLDVIDAEGDWVVEEIDGGSRVTLLIRFDAQSADTGAVSLPRFVSIGWVIDRVKPLVRKEAEAIVERIVADLEGEPRDVQLDIEVRRDR